MKCINPNKDKDKDTKIFSPSNKQLSLHDNFVKEQSLKTKKMNTNQNNFTKINRTQAKGK